MSKAGDLACDVISKTKKRSFLLKCSQGQMSKVSLSQQAQTHYLILNKQGYVLNARNFIWTMLSLAMTTA